MTKPSPDTFTKFDHLGSVLTEIDYNTVGLSMTRHPDGSVWFYSVDLHIDGNCYSGMSTDTPTPSDALAKALAKASEAQVARVEAAANRIAA